MMYVDPHARRAGSRARKRETIVHTETLINEESATDRVNQNYVPTHHLGPNRYLGLDN